MDYEDKAYQIISGCAGAPTAEYWSAVCKAVAQALAEARRQGMEEAAKIAREHWSQEMRSRERALSRGKDFVAECRQSGAEAASAIMEAIEAKAKEGE